MPFVSRLAAPLVVCLGLLAPTVAPAQDAAAPKAAKKPAPKPATTAAATTAAPASEDDNVLYALGLAVARNLQSFHLSETELKKVQEGLSDTVLGRKPKVEFDAYAPKLQALLQTRVKAAAEVEKKAGAAFLEKQAAVPGTVKQPAGFLYRETKAGGGATPAPTDRVKVHYTGKLMDGTTFDSSVDRGEPVTFPLNQVIGCWSQGVPLMKVGGKAHLVCPPELAYGDRGAPPKIGPGATLSFDVELLEIVKDAPAAAPAAPATPK